MTDDPVGTIARDPTWLAHRYDPGHDAVHFLKVPRAAHGRATFLTDQYLGSELAPAVIERAPAVAAARPAAGPIHFVFHAAFCCSTLIARALDRPGWAMGLKEPTILNDVVGWRRRGAAVPELRSVLDDALTLMARSFAPGEPIVVKPSNVVNGLAMTMMELRPDAHALLMYAPLPDFLASIAKKGLDGRIFARDLFLNQLRDGLVRFGFDQNALFTQTDLQIAALGWLVQVQLFHAMAERFGPQRVRTLRSDALLAHRGRAVEAMAHLFDLAADPAILAAVADGPGFTTHSKTGVAFGSSARTDEYARATDLHAEEIFKVLDWARTVASQTGVAMDPGTPLLS